MIPSAEICGHDKTAQPIANNIAWPSLYSEDPYKSDEEGRVKQEESKAEIAALCDKAVIKKLVIVHFTSLCHECGSIGMLQV